MDQKALPAVSPRAAMTATLWSGFAACQTHLLAAFLIVVLAALVLPPLVFLLKASVADAQRRRRMEPRQFRSGARKPPFPRHQRELAGVRGRQRGARAGDRLDHRLDRRAHQYAAQAARLSDRDHLARHALHPVCHRLAVVVRQGRPGQSALPHAHRDGRHPDQRLFHARHDHGRGLPVVAAGVSPGGRDAAQRQSGAGGGRARERRRRLGDHPRG